MVREEMFRYNFHLLLLSYCKTENRRLATTQWNDAFEDKKTSLISDAGTIIHLFSSENYNV